MKIKTSIIIVSVGYALTASFVRAVNYELWATGSLWNSTNSAIARFSATDGTFLGYFMHPTNGTGVVINQGTGAISGVGVYGKHVFVGYFAGKSDYKVGRYEIKDGNVTNIINSTNNLLSGVGGDWRTPSTYYYPIRSFAFTSEHIYLLAGAWAVAPQSNELYVGSYIFRHTSAGAGAGVQPNTPSGYSRGAQFSAHPNFAAIGSVALGMACDASGNFYALVTPPAVYRFAPDGSYYGPAGMGDTTPFISTNTMPTAFRDPAGIAIDNAGRLYFGGKTGSGSVTSSLLLRYNADGTPAGTNQVDAIFSRYVNYLKGVVTPVSLAISPLDGYLYVGNGYVSSPRYENMINRYYTSGPNDGKIVEEGGFANIGGSNSPLYLPNTSILFVPLTPPPPPPSLGTFISLK